MKIDKDYEIEYENNNGDHTIRKISPIRFFSYESTEYLEAYCHLRIEIRTFKIRSIKNSKQLKNKSISKSPTYPEKTWEDSTRFEETSSYLPNDIKEEKTYWTFKRIMFWVFCIWIAFLILE